MRRIARTKLKQHRRYTGKLREDLDTFSREVFVLGSDRERVQSILQDLNKTARDFAGIGGRAVEQMSTLLVGRSRCVFRLPTSQCGVCSFV